MVLFPAVPAYRVERKIVEKMHVFGSKWVVFILTLLGGGLGYGYFMWAQAISQPAHIYGNFLVSAAFGAGVGFFVGLKVRDVFLKKKRKSEE